jgi:hypothetical protein
MSGKQGIVVLLGVCLLGGVLLLTSRNIGQAAAQGGAAQMGTGGPRYTVIDTEAHNLLVTDNVTNTVYFYTIDKDKEVGSDLKLRASIDLSQVGKNEIVIKKAAK